jgi:hypothetical protein
MSWRLEGTYLESCNCDMLCPCTWSAFAAPATNERCNVVLGYHVDSGEVDGVDVSGLSFALVFDAPRVMSDGGWRAGVYLDAAASDEQADKLTAVVSGSLGGPPAALGPLIGEMLGVERAQIDYSDDGSTHRLRIGGAVDIEVADLTVGELPEPVRLTNVFHPSNTTLTVSPATRASVDAFGLSYGREGESGFTAPFRWAA